MYALGMGVYKMAPRAGWEVMPFGQATAPSDVPFISHLGLVLVY
jgi:hypothetical protein